MPGGVAIDRMHVPYGNHVHACAGYATAPIPTVPARQTPVIVMTDEQVEVLRRQISVYSTLCKQLEQMHKASIQEQGIIPGVSHAPHINSLPFDPGMVGNSFHQKVQARQRWTPSQKQLQFLERLFSEGGGTPSKLRIKEITAELSQHGPVQETNVYNWFQNRKARAKRKMPTAGGTDISDGETDGECPTEALSESKKPRLNAAVSYQVQDIGRR